MRNPLGGGLALFLILVGSGAAFGRELRIGDRIRAQEAIERVRYAHQLGSTRPFEEAVPRSVLENRVLTYLRRSAALESLWTTPITDEMLEREYRRMVAQSRSPERLSELFAAMDNDPFVIKECLVRPALIDRLARNAFASDPALHASRRDEAEELRRGLLRLGVERFADDPRRTVVELMRAGDVEAAQAGPRGAEAPAIALNLEAFARWRGRAPGRVGDVGAVRSERDAFVISVVLDERPGSATIAHFSVPKRSFNDWWESVESDFDPRTVAAVAGGTSSTHSEWAAPRDRDRERGRASPAFPEGHADAWDDGTLDDLPHARFNPVKVWTGSEIVVWGGINGAVPRSGGRYDPSTDSWTAMATRNAPSSGGPRRASWTGREVAFWAGDDPASAGASGGYDPMTDTWRAAPSGVVPTRDREDAVAGSGPSAASGDGPMSASSTASSSDPLPELPANRVNEPPGVSENSGSQEMPYISETQTGFVFPTDRPVASEIMLGAQGTDFGYCEGGPVAGRECTRDSDCQGGTCPGIFDNTFCLSYNMTCASQRTNQSEFGFSDVFEATYDSSPAAGRQTWIEKNWNYISPEGVFFRPFHFALEVDAQGTCAGGTNEGDWCTLLDPDGRCKGGGTCAGPSTGGARWTFTPNGRNGNSSLQLRWPFVAANARLGTDSYFHHGFSSWMRSSDFNPGTSTAGGFFSTYLDHRDDRKGPLASGLQSVIDFNTTNVDGQVGWVNAGFFDARISGSTPGRTITALTGVRSEVNLASTGGPQLVGQSYGVFVRLNPSGTGLTNTSHSGILISTPAPPGSGTTIGTLNGLWIADQQLVRSGGGGSAILVSAQTASDGSEGNVRLEGGNWNNGHIQLFQGHVWRDAVRGVLRYKNASAPVSEIDGNPLVTGTGSDAHGVVLWGVSTAIDPNFDTGNEVCAASGVGLRCVDTSDINRDTTTPCDQAHTRPKWLAFCK